MRRERERRLMKEKVVRVAIRVVRVIIIELGGMVVQVCVIVVLEVGSSARGMRAYV